MFPSVSNIVLKVLPTITEMGLVFLSIVDFNDGIEYVLFLTFSGLAEDLFGRDLDGGRGTVFYAALVG